MTAIREVEVLARSVFSVRTALEVEQLIAAVPSASWQPLGGKRGNYAQVNVGSNPADALVEKITNGMDAVIERAALTKGRTDFISPRAAADVLLGVPRGHVANMRDAEARRALAENLVVTLRDSEDSKLPTVVVEDHGIGQHPDDFPRTLVSLNEDNKRRQLYLIGAYGWGGAAAFAFSKYAIFISRRDPFLHTSEQDDSVGWTIVRYNALEEDEGSKTGVYEYLCVTDSFGRPKLPRFGADSLPESMRGWIGTTCILVQFEFGRYANEPAFRPSRSLWILANALLFDPVMPFLVRDERSKAVQANQKSALEGIVISGNAARLAFDASKSEKAKRIAYSGSWQGRLSLSDEGRVILNYFVIAQTGEYKKDWDPTHTYVPPEQAVTITHNGQRQGGYPRELFERLGLISLSKFLIVHVDCDELSWKDKKRLFSSTRDRLKDSDIARELREEVEKALRSDEQLRKLDSERKQLALSRRSKEHAERIRRLLDNAIDSLRAGSEETHAKTRSTKPDLPRIGDKPLLDETPEEAVHGQVIEVKFGDQPTELRVLTPTIRVPAGGRAVVRLRLDAPDDYISAGNLGDESRGRFIPIITKGTELFRIDGFSSLRDSLMRCTLSAESARSDDRGRAIFTVMRGPDSLPLIAEAEIVAIEPPVRRARPAGRVEGAERGPAVEPVYRDMWETFGFDEGVVAKVEENSPQPGMTTIYVNWDYPALNARLLSARGLSPERGEAHKEKFAAAMALMAWLQQKDRADVQQEEMRRAAHMFLFTEFLE